MLLRLALFLLLLFEMGACTPPESPTPSPTALPRPSSAPATALPASPTPAATPSPAATSHCRLPGRLVAARLESSTLGRPLRYQIYLPPCYAGQTASRYPLLFLFHGLYYDETQWVRLGLAPAADRLIASGEIPPLLIVLPYDPTWTEPPESQFGQALLADLLPALEATYRLLPERQVRAVGGLSRGAGWALHLGLTRPDLFAAIGAHSPIVFGRDANHIAEWLANLSADQPLRFYLDIGQNDTGLPQALWLEGLLDDAALPHEWHLNQGTHDEAYWSSHLEEYLLWYASGWR
ncbi:MAG: alpha/beta hydrolase-fold protein [Anaerolineales bacterium]